MKKRRYQWVLWFCLGILLVTGIGAPASARLQLSAQITDPANFQGVITGRFFSHNAAVDVYILLVTATDSIFSLYQPSRGAPYGWQPGVHLFSSHPSLSIDNWGYLSPVDFSPAREDASRARIFALLVQGGADLYEPSHWVDWQGVQLIIDPSERQIGQNFFLSSSSTIYRDWYGANTGGTTPGATPPGPEESESVQTAVEKPDIFKIVGNMLFYANSGASKLQLADLANPSQPALLASLPMEGIPQELYVVGNYCFLLEQTNPAAEQSVKLKSYTTGTGTLQEVSQLNFPLVSYKISRRLGERIFLVAISGQAQDGGRENAIFMGDPVIYSVDISNPQQLRIIAQEVLRGYDPIVHLDNHYLILSTQEDWATTILHIFDLLASGGEFSTMATLRIPGRIPSEYHIHTSDFYLYVVFREEGQRQGSALAIYNLSDFRNIREVGRVDEIAPGEELYATRFHGNRAYVVTFERQDPLWVIDLQNPAQPTIIGTLEVPGWSEYMEFFDDKLLAVGYDDREGRRLVSVALFSVGDPGHPALLDRITPFSGQLLYTNSDAVEDERAFYVNHESGIILLPLHYDQEGAHSGLEIIHLAASRSAFARHHYVESGFRVRRGTESNVSQIVVGMGDAAINTIGLSPASEPVILGRLRLAFNVEQAALVDSRERLWTVGGDFYCCNAAELLVFDTNDLGSPLLVENTGLIMSVLTAGQNGPGHLGVLFSNASAQFKAIDIESMTMGRLFPIGEEYGWSLESPLVFGRVFYVATANQTPGPWPIEPLHGINEPAIQPLEPSVAPFPGPPYEPPLIQWHLKRFDCADINNPVPLPEISIPGRPLGFTEDGKLVTVENHYYYIFDDGYFILRDIVPPPQEEGVRLNVLAIVGDQAILEATHLFAYDHFRNPQVIMDNQHVFLTIQEETSTTVLILNPHDLSELRRATVNDRLVPIKALRGKVLLTTEPVYYLERPLRSRVAGAAIMPEYRNEGGFVVYDFSTEIPRLLLRRSGEYINASQVTMTSEGLFIARGYAGISFIPYEF